MADESTREGMISGTKREDDVGYDLTLRPKTLREYIGQRAHKENLEVFVQAAIARGEPLEHVLIHGPPGLGKTTLAQILANELGVQMHATSGPAIEHKGALAGMLTRLSERDVLFIDEIHRLQPAVEENLYPAIEDFRIDIVTGDGPHAQAIQLPLQPFTLVAATTRTALVTGPLRSRFGMEIRLDFYPPEDLALIVHRSARMLKIAITDDAAMEIATRARGTPRIANRLLRRARDFAQVAKQSQVECEIARLALDRLGVDRLGLDEMDRRLLRVLIENFNGGPAGLETLAAALAEPKDTIEDVYEPFLLRQGLLLRTPRGRHASLRAYNHLGVSPPAAPPGGPQGTLFGSG
ncbi:MAG: Holliday junction branch migration DNA helicase RuvB [Deltaproteobacteria bacterium]|nr:Holliday junction branch migration DNA helicase RuvB [Deltaproteobacteria bacterium]